MTLEIVTKKAWGAMPSQWEISLMDRPASAVWVFFTGQNNCRTREECDPLVKELQRYHIEEKENFNPDLPYSFLVSSDGLVYEGRGWEYSTPEPYDRPDLVNKRYIFAYIGDDWELEHTAAYRTMQKLLEYGIKNNYIKKDYEKYQWEDSELKEEESEDENEDEADQETVDVNSDYYKAMKPAWDVMNKANEQESDFSDDDSDDDYDPYANWRLPEKE